jgi:hypothetical protein
VPVRHQIDVATGVIELELWGSVSKAEIVAYYSALANDPAIRAGLVVLADCRRVTSGPSFLDLHSLANAKAQLAPGLRPARAAVLVHKGWLYGIVRQFAAMIERLGIHVMPFDTEEAARRWLVLGSNNDKRVASSHVIGRAL